MANKIDFVIGGKDQASAAMDSVEKSLGRLEQTSQQTGDATSRLANLTTGLVVAYGALKAGMALISGLDAVNTAYETQVEAVRDLNNALALQGANVGVESARLQQFAADMQKLTGVGDEVTLGLLKQAQAMGVATDQLDDMARAGIGLGKAFGASAEGGMEMMRQAQQRNFAGFEAMFPQMKFMRSDNEKLAFATQLAARGLDQQAEASHGAAGMAGRAAGALGDLQEMVGAMLAPVRVLVNAGLITLAESLQNVLAPAAKYATGVLEDIGPMVEWVQGMVVAGVNVMVEAFTFFEVILTNLDSVWQIVVAGAELYMLQISESVMHALTVEIPAYAVWFGENFVNLMRDALMLAVTVVTNHVTKLIDTFGALWDYIASAGSSDVLGQLGEIAGRSYLEGFESSLTSLPDVAVRKITEREKQLADTMGELGSRLGDEFAKKVEERLVDVNKLTDEKQAELSSGVNLNFDARQLEATTVQATQGRLLTRGPGSYLPNKLDEIINLLKRPPRPPKQYRPLLSLDDQATALLQGIKANTGKGTKVIPVP